MGHGQNKNFKMILPTSQMYSSITGKSGTTAREISMAIHFGLLGLEMTASSMALSDIGNNYKFESLKSRTINQMFTKNHFKIE